MTPLVLPAEGVGFEAEADVVVIGAGAAGLVAALSAAGCGVSVVVLERDRLPRGSTALSAGLIPAAGTRFQKARGIEDSPERFAADIAAKSRGAADPSVLAAVTTAIGPTLEWLADRHGLPFEVITDFLYPGHSAHRMHGLPSRSGAELMDRLLAAAEREGVPVLTEARVTTLFARADGLVRGVAAARPGGEERIGAGAVVLACSGFGGNRALVRRHIPALADALWFGHPGNTGDALAWGEAFGAATAHLSGHQGHGSVAHPHGILITWAVIMEGGFQVNARGERFSDETEGYSEQAERVLAQPGGIAWDVFDGRIAAIARQFEDFRAAEAAGAVLSAPSLAALAEAMRVPAAVLEGEVAAARGRDRFGRDWSRTPSLAPPFHAVRVTGALFHTQGGLMVGPDARVLRRDGSALPNLFAAGGAAAGLSGPIASGYLSGNGLLTAVALGRIAGLEAGGRG
ncbi:FAD-dependent oxidoreductase [Elioraea tepida]|uniref:FAD-dependent oxidoreductase n=1 Tax=Elioraea tepida TaxID=2843330 RepID=A0A975U101_9PROT|nr:FAD-dependent oxidoreductase [Elioraea tepida]QXM23788.1 FAD-dependent oxidoreductase [Elioraea tepida]